MAPSIGVSKLQQSQLMGLSSTEYSTGFPVKRVTAQKRIVFLEFHPTLRVVSILGGDVPRGWLSFSPRLGALKSDLDPIAFLRHCWLLLVSAFYRTVDPVVQ